LTDVSLIRGSIYFLLNFLFFKSISFPFRKYKNSSIYHKGRIRFGKGVVVPEKAYISPLSLEVGDYCWLGVNSFICGKDKIGSYVSIGPNVVIPGAEHNIACGDRPIRRSGLIVKGTVIEDNVWIGANCVILDGVRIGSGSVIGAGSIVTKDVPPNKVVHGQAAGIRKERLVF
jgi:maltose O-acetyltransferase